MKMREIIFSLVDFIEKNDIADRRADDGDGRIDSWRSQKFIELIEKAKKVCNYNKEIKLYNCEVKIGGGENKK